MIGFKIKKYRELRNYSQDYIAEKLGISQNAYSRIESNQTKLTIERLKKIATVLEIPEEDLINSDPMVFTFNNHDHSKGHANFGNIYEVQKDLYEKILVHLKDENAKTADHLREEIKSLRKEKESLINLLKTKSR